MSVGLGFDIQRELATLCDLGSERSVLTLMLNDPDTCYEVFSSLKPSDFYNTGNKIIAEIIFSVVNGEDKNISRLNATLVRDIAEKKGVLDKIGGADYIYNLATLEVAKENLKYYINQIKLFALKREVYQAGIQITRDTLESDETTLEGFFASVEKRLLDVGNSYYKRDDNAIGYKVMDFVQDRMSNSEKYSGIMTGFPELDEEIGGLEPKRLYVLCARSKGGKSATFLNIALNVALQGIPVAYYDTEMSSDEQLSRAIAILSGVPEKHIRKGYFASDAEELSAVWEAAEIIKNIPLYHRSVIGAGISEIKNLIRLDHLKHGIKLVVFDYIKSTSSVNLATIAERQYLGQLATLLKDIANEYDLVVLAGSQLNRSAVGASEITEDMIAESDRIAWFADMTLYQRRKTDDEIKEDGVDNGNLVITVGLSRIGGEYEGWFDFDRRTLRLTEIRNVAKWDALMAGDQVEHSAGNSKN